MSKIFMLFFAISSSLFLIGCDGKNLNINAQQSTSGVTKKTVKIETDMNGETTEQKNIARRLLEDNKPGSIKYFYCISALTGDVIIFSTVDGKVTSSGKRLSPTTVVADAGNSESFAKGPKIEIGSETYRTPELIQDDGTYGGSVEYLYWWDTKGVFHTHYPTGGQIVHITNQPLRVKHVMIDVTGVAEATQ